MADSRNTHNHQLPQPGSIIQSVAPMPLNPLVYMRIDFSLYNLYFQDT